MLKIEEIKVGDYDFLFGKTFVLSNARDISFYIGDETNQRLKMTIRLSDNPDEPNSFKSDENDDHHINLVFNMKSGKMVSREFIRMGTFDEDSKPLFMSFYVSSLSETSRLFYLNFYTLKHGEDIG